MFASILTRDLFSFTCAIRSSLPSIVETKAGTLQIGDKTSVDPTIYPTIFLRDNRDRDRDRDSKTLKIKQRQRDSARDRDRDRDRDSKTLKIKTEIST